MPGSKGTLDLKVLEQLRDIGAKSNTQLLNQLIEIFETDVPADISAIEEALASGDLKTAEQKAHSIKSSAANLGAVLVQDAAKQIETAARSGQADEVRKDLALLRDVFDAALKELRVFTQP